jgi:SH3-like domain-containing protein
MTKRAKKTKLTVSGALLCAALGMATCAHAFDFVSVAEPAILYDAPSIKAKKLFVATRYLPLEQVVTLDNWVKVRDVSGQLYWIEKRSLSSKRFVIVNVPVAEIHAGSDEKSAVVFKAPQQLALEWLGDAEGGWVKVRHLDGTAGYIKITEVWGD